jgi:dTDP-4-dehydrorhamnose 3,5-epimerase
MAFSFKRDIDFDGVLLITPFHASDRRGDFTKYYEKGIYQENGIEFDIIEEFVTASVKNVIRGLHFQTVNPQAKLITTIAGAIFDVVVDLRRHSNTFCQWKGYELTAVNKTTLYVPKGFAHGFYTLGNDNIVAYKCDAPYLSQHDGGVVWNDPELNIQWPLKVDNPIVSEKDDSLMTLKEFKRAFGGF